MKQQPEFEDLMNWLQVDGPSVLQREQWKRALRQRAHALDVEHLPRWSQWAVAGLIGFVIGLAAMAGVPLTSSSSENAAQSATIEMVYTNLE